jgi:translation initiation factor RLI1
MFGKTGELCPNFGKPKSAEHKEKISKKLKGRSLSPEHKKKISESLKRMHREKTTAVFCNDEKSVQQ